jgi:hypothetical protein
MITNRGFPFFYPSVVPRQCRVAQVGVFEMVKTAPSKHEPMAQPAVERVFANTGLRFILPLFLKEIPSLYTA